MVYTRDETGNRQTAAPLNIDTIVQLPKNIKLNNKVSHAEGGKSRRVVKFQPCISCGAEKPVDQFHPVPYKTVLLHFEQIMVLMNADAHFTHGTASWPPDPSIVVAAGGVGFGTSRFNQEQEEKRLAEQAAERAARKGGSAEEEYQAAVAAAAEKPALSVTEEDVTIPPMIRHLHPKLTAKIFRRYRRDPLFLYKNALVCEDCYLVFAELASAPAINGAQLRRTQSAPPNQMPRFGETSAVSGVTAEDWANAPGTHGGRSSKFGGGSVGFGGGAAGKSVGSGGSGMSKSRRAAAEAAKAQKAAMTQPAPKFPSAIRSTQGIAESMGSVGSTFGPGTGGNNNNTGMMGGELTGDVDVEELIQQREDAFFKEISGEPSVRKGHPLTHLVTSHDKIESASRPLDVTSGTGLGNAKGKGSTLSSGVRAPKVGASPYSVPLKLVDVKDDELRRKAAKKKKAAAAADKIAGTSVAMSRSSSKHRDFLMQTLKDVQHQLTTPNALKSFVEYHTQRVADETVAEERSQSTTQRRKKKGGGRGKGGAMARGGHGAGKGNERRKLLVGKCLVLLSG